MLCSDDYLRIIKTIFELMKTLGLHSLFVKVPRKDYSYLQRGSRCRICTLSLLHWESGAGRRRSADCMQMYSKMQLPNR
jgi:hypothetical protein